MCNSAITICTSCTTTSTKLQGCDAFATFKTKSNKADMNPDSPGWASEHAATSPTAMTNRITVLVCMSCKATAKPKTDGKTIATAIEKATCNLVGTFKLVTTGNKMIVPPWVKLKCTTYSVNLTTGVGPETDAETTETETEGDEETEAELDTDNDTEGRLRAVSK